VKVLVTGATGLVGLQICRELTLRGHKVVGISKRGQLDDSENWETWAIDLSDLNSIDSLSKRVKCDAVVHAAAEIDMMTYNRNLISSNCAGTLNALWLAEKWKAGSFIFLSSVQVVGNFPTSKVYEDTTPNPSTTYHATKLFGEFLVSHASTRGIRPTSLRISAPIGLNMPRSRFLSTLCERASKGETIELEGFGKRRQDYVDTRDVALAVAKSLDLESHGIYNIASGISKSNLEVAELVNSYFGNRSELVLKGGEHQEDVVNWDISVEKARQELDWMPRHSFIDSVEYISK
jgi:nucleoside-diphosphate-sugar epimerase